MHPRWRERMPEADRTVWVEAVSSRAEQGVGQVFDIAWRSFLPDFLPLPHPSWRNIGWLKRNPWFESELVPALQAQVRRALAG